MRLNYGVVVMLNDTVNDYITLSYYHFCVIISKEVFFFLHMSLLIKNIAGWGLAIYKFY